MPEENLLTIGDKVLITICTLGMLSCVFGTFLLLSLLLVGGVIFWLSAKFIFIGIVLVAISKFLDRFNKNSAV